MKKAVTLFVIGLVIVFAYFLFTGDDNKAQGIFVVIVISVGMASLPGMMPTQEGLMKKSIRLMLIGFAIALPGWLIAAFVHDYGIAGAFLFFIGWLVAATGMLMGIWNNHYPASQRWLGIGMKIGVIGFLIFFLGALLEVPDDMETLSNILVKVGQYILYIGMFFGFLGVIEDHMHK